MTRNERRADQITARLRKHYQGAPIAFVSDAGDDWFKYVAVTETGELQRMTDLVYLGLTPVAQAAETVIRKIDRHLAERA